MSITWSRHYAKRDSKGILIGSYKQLSDAKMKLVKRERQYKSLAERYKGHIDVEKFDVQYVRWMEKFVQGIIQML